MPLYEYRCEKCGKVFEVRQKFVDEPVRTHEECGGTVERLVSAPSFNFKGSGWYVNDYAKGSKSDSNGESGKSESSSEKKESGSGSKEKKEAAPAAPTSSEKASSSTSSTDSKSSSS